MVIADRSMFTKYVETGMGHHIKELPLRYMPPGNLRIAWAVYAGEGPHCASYATFIKEFNTNWKSNLRFRQKHDFADCRTCTELKRDLAMAGTLATQAESVRALQDHYRNVMMNRDLEEVFRTTPPFGIAQPVLCVFTDGMEQSHWSIPRLRHHRGSKSLSAFQRPRAKVQGVWCFYYGIHMYIADATMPHDASLTCEVIARALERCREVARRRGIELPKELVVFADNTTRENKNNTLLQFLAYLVASAQFNLTALLNHDMGHSHNILDQLYGIIARSFQYVDKLEDLDAVVDAMRDILQRDGLRDFLGPDTEVHCEALQSVRSWGSWLSTMGVTYEGAMRWPQ